MSSLSSSSGCSGLMVWLGMPALFWLINGDIKGTNIALLASVTFVGGAAASVAGVNIRPLIMNVNEPEMRGMALSLQVFCLPTPHPYFTHIFLSLRFLLERNAVLRCGRWRGL